jgi:very-short-patch-repair endonuclease
MPRLLGPDPALPVVFTLQQARAAGLTTNQVRYRVACGRWTRLSRDTYRRTDWLPDGLDRFAEARLDHVHRAVAAVRRNPGSTIGYASATATHGLPLISRLPEEVTLVVPPGAWTGTRHGIRFRQGVLVEGDVSGASVAVTSPERTWLDMARTAPLADSLALGDAGLRTGALDRQRLADRVEASRGSRGCRRAATALAHLDPARETPLESDSWAYFLQHRIPLPEMQVEFRSGSGRFIARVDFWWRRARLVGECDGRLKYRTPEDVYAEKRREDEIRAEGCGVLRWGAGDLRGPHLAVRLRRALA